TPSVERDHAGPRGGSVNQQGAGAAFAEPTAVFRSVQGEVVAQHIEQCSVGSRFDIVSLAVDGQPHRALRHAPPSPRCVAKPCTGRSGKMPFVYNRASALSRAAAGCSLYGQRGEANEVLCGKREIWPLGPLDSVQVRAQHRSYTNK